jgi:hypothetical protein
LGYSASRAYRESLQYNQRPPGKNGKENVLTSKSRSLLQK